RFNVKSVIFDMDGVITNTMPDHFRSWKAIFKEEGIHVTYEDIYKREGQPGLSSVTEIFREHNKAFSKKEAAKVLKKKEVLFKRIVKTRFITGARTFLKHLHKKDIRLALVTGTSRHELRQILPVSLRDLFSVIVTGNEVKHGKPHPEPYLKSLQELKIESSQAVVIENAPFGIRSAKQAGLKCLALETSLPKQYLREADMIFPSIKELENKASFSIDRDTKRIRRP
ncbi:MAG: HAD family phosphatase, partial [Candidatus Omnitrophica bacterium]|nr:HAD family phosphatase [Candidatus Omnitrophota bacterium]